MAKDIAKDMNQDNSVNRRSTSTKKVGTSKTKRSGDAPTLLKEAPKERDAQFKNASDDINARDVAKWQKVQAQLKAKLGTDVYASWFGRCRLEALSKSQLVHSVPTNFLKNWIQTHYADDLLKLWKKQKKDLLRVDIVVRSAMRNGDGSSVPLNGASDAAPSNNLNGRNGIASRSENGVNGSPLDKNYTFETFVEGASNRMACAAARSVAEANGSALRFNPLFIHAGVGLGKTHLLQAIAWAAAERSSSMRILYLTAEYFMWRFASALRNQTALSFKESLRDIDLLLIDDMQFLQGKAIQQEFCHLLNALIDSAKQVVVAADRPPPELESLDARVRSRLQGGVALDIKSPDLTMRRQMLHMRYREAQREDSRLEIPTEILDFVATKVTSSGRDLEGAFNQLLIQHRFSEGPVEMDVIEKMLGHLVQSHEQRRVRIEDIQKVVSRHYNVSRNDLLSSRRTRVIVRPRQIAMYLSKVLTPRSLPEIGRRFSGRDHTTVLHAVRKIETLLEKDNKLSQEIELLKRLIHEQGI